MSEHHNNQTFILRVYRGVPNQQYWEEFELKREPGKNIISALMDIQRNPVNRQGKHVEPVVWESGCLEEVCGSCSMLINSFPRQACTAIIDNILEESGKNVITLAPFTKFPLIRDLIINRDSMFDNLKKVQAWIDADGSYDRGFGPKISQQKQEVMYALSTCMTCGCCVEACPQMNTKSKFIGPQIISQVRLFNDNPTGELQKSNRLVALMNNGGANCGAAQNCAKVCPKKIPLTESISAVYKDLNRLAIRKIFGLPDRE